MSDYTPKINIPGFVFYSNHGKSNPVTKENWNPHEIQKYLSKKENISIDDIIVLENVVEGMSFSSFIQKNIQDILKIKSN